MIVEIVSNWKVISVGGAMLLSAAGATYTYIEGVDERLDVVEIENAQAVEDRAEIKCMIVQHDVGGEPLECVE